MDNQPATPSSVPSTESPDLDDSNISIENQKVSTIGPYIIQKILGEGTTGKVKLAYHKDTGEQVAIKIISKSSFDQKPNLQMKVRREIALMRVINHPNILNFIDVYESQRHLCIILEYAQNGELFDFLVARRFLPVDMAMNFFRQIVLAIEYLHFHQICHRDLKPENILLNKFNRIKIADFGFARLVKKNTTETSCGSPHYAAPEVIRGIPYDPKKADIWSLGVILYALLAGFLPFDDPSIRVVLRKVKKGTYTMPEFPADIVNLIQNLLVVDPNGRLTIEQIKEHPAFRRNLDPLYYLPTPIPDVTALHQLDLSSISPEIKKILIQMGFTDEEELNNQLKSSDATMAKSFVAMLTAQLDLDLLPWDELALGALDETEGDAQSNPENDSTNKSETENQTGMEKSESNGKNLNLTSESSTFSSSSAVDIISGIEGSSSGSKASRQGFDPFHRQRMPIGSHPSLDVNSINSVMIRPDWAFETTTPVSNIIATAEKPFYGLDIWRIMRKVQEAADDCGLQWFHPDPMILYARTQDASFYVSVIAKDKEMDEISISTFLHRGLTDQFSDFNDRLFQALDEPLMFV